MQSTNGEKAFLRARIAIMAVGAAAIVTGSMAAPTTQGLILQATSVLATAAAGNRTEAYVFISVYNEAGPVRGITAGSLSLAVAGAPAGAVPVRKTSVREPVSGVYRISLAPELSSHRWSSGSYVIGITLTSSNGSGVVLATLEIDR